MNNNGRKKSIYWLHSHFLLNTGGTRFVYDVIANLHKYYHITVVVEKCSDYWKKKYESLGVRVREISPLSSNSLVYWLFFPVFFILEVIEMGRLVRPDDVLISTMFPMQSVAVFVSRKTLFYCYEPFTYFYDSTLQKSHTYIQQILIKFLALLYRPLDKYGAKKSSSILTINEVTKYWIEQLYQRVPTAVTYLGVDTEMFNTDKKPIHEKKKDITVIFHSTDYTALKGTDYVLDAALLLKERGVTNIHFYISETVRNQQTYIKYQNIINENGLNDTVHFVGHVPYADLPGYYRFADIYFFAGDPESTGATSASMSVLEAGACGTPSIRTYGENKEVINMQTGIFIDPRDTKKTVEAILYLHNDGAARREMGEKAKKYIISLYTWKNVALKFREEIERIGAYEKTQ